MVFLNPERVTLGSHTLTNVALVTIDREARRVTVEYSDLGRFAAFADVPEERITVRIVRRVTREETDAIKPGDKLALGIRTGPGLSAAGARAISATVVITGIESSMDARSRGHGAGATQRVTALAVSADGATDPIVVTGISSEV